MTNDAAIGAAIVKGGKYAPVTDQPPSGEFDSAGLLDAIETWFRRFIAVPDDYDLSLLALWTVSTHLAVELYTTPRLLIDSTMPGSGKTTVLDHLNRLAHSPVQAASLSSPALLVRMLEHGVRTVLIDEVDRSLSPNKPGVDDLIGILNSGYRRGATRPVLVPVKGGGWEVREMPTFAPVAMAGNSPRLPDDTVSRSLRVLLMPDLDGAVEDSDWELIEDEAGALHDQIQSFADSVRPAVSGLTVDLPAGCVGRAKEKWRPLKRVAVAAGGRWPDLADQLIQRGLSEDGHERDAGLRSLPPGMVLMEDLHATWPGDDDFVPTKELVAGLVRHNPEYWGPISAYGKALTETRFGRMVTQASKVTSQRPGGRGPRGYTKEQFIQVWHRLGIGRSEPGALGEPGAPGANRAANLHQVHRVNQVHRVERVPPAPGAERRQDSQNHLDFVSPPGGVTAATPGMTDRVQRILNGTRSTPTVTADPPCHYCGNPVVGKQAEPGTGRPAHYTCATKSQEKTA